MAKLPEKATAERYTLWRETKRREAEKQFFSFSKQSSMLVAASNELVATIVYPPWKGKM